jgi:hypothetical protein
MKIILSRKGFDSSAGAMPSPILPDGSLLSLPIPRNDSHYRYNDLVLNERKLGSIIYELSNGKLSGGEVAHVDPDLDYGRLPRPQGWKPIFGQHGGDQTHLQNCGIGPGDLFLFFGWFQKTELVDGLLRYAAKYSSAHIIFGWLQVDEVVAINQATVKLPDWALNHPHVAKKEKYELNNTIYIATDTLNINGFRLPLNGGGVFHQFHPILQLTWPGLSRSYWKLPRWFYPIEGRQPLSYHKKINRWKIKDEFVLLESAARG